MTPTNEISLAFDRQFDAAHQTRSDARAHTRAALMAYAARSPAQPLGSSADAPASGWRWAAAAAVLLVGATAVTSAAAWRSSASEPGLAAIGFADQLAEAVQPRLPVVAMSPENGRDDDPSSALITAEDEAIAVRFAHAARFDLQPRSTGGVVPSFGPGEHLVLTSGRARATMADFSDPWVVDAGPFRATAMTPSTFDLDWQPTSHFGLSVARGEVEVRGPMLDDTRRVRAGQRLEVDLDEGRVSLVDPEAGKKAREKATSRPRTRPKASQTKTGVRTIGQGQAGAQAGAWMSHAVAGDYERAYAVAGPVFKDITETAPADQLLKLADVARFSGHPKSARKTLLAFRRRFPAHAERSTAAFTLGRLAFEHERDYSSAAHWFETVLREQKVGGSLHREALERLIEARAHAGNVEGAKTAASQYLSSYPRGPRAEQARRRLSPER